MPLVSPVKLYFPRLSVTVGFRCAAEDHRHPTAISAAGSIVPAMLYVVVEITAEALKSTPLTSAAPTVASWWG